MPEKTMQGLYDYAISFWGLPYVWGADGPDAYDCSGLVQEILSYAGKDPKGDQTAQTLYDHFLKKGLVNTPGLGAVCFFGSMSHITHVGFCLDKALMINASGGGRHVTSLVVAKQCNASIKIEPIRKRPDLVAVIMPFYHMPIS